MKDNMKQLNIRDFPESLRKKLKIYCATNDISMRQVLIQLVGEIVEQRKNTVSELDRNAEHLLRGNERIKPNSP